MLQGRTTVLAGHSHRHGLHLAIAVVVDGSIHLGSPRPSRRVCIVAVPLINADSVPIVVPGAAALVACTRRAHVGSGSPALHRCTPLIGGAHDPRAIAHRVQAHAGPRRIRHRQAVVPGKGSHDETFSHNLDLVRLVPQADVRVLVVHRQAAVVTLVLLVAKNKVCAGLHGQDRGPGDQVRLARPLAHDHQAVERLGGGRCVVDLEPLPLAVRDPVRVGHDLHDLQNANLPCGLVHHPIAVVVDAVAIHFFRGRKNS